jgi:competence protein ComEA
MKITALKEYFIFSRRDRVGILVILGLIVAIFLLPAVLKPTSRSIAVRTDTTLSAYIKKLGSADTINDEIANRQYENHSYSQNDHSKTNYYEKDKGELFYFDPNKITNAEWQRLGLRDKIIHIIENYLKKGGHFKTPEDLQKVYGLSLGEYERLAPYVRIETTIKNVALDATKITAPKAGSPSSRVIEINSADTTAFILLPGIGSKLAARIINFRDKLGGFYSINQVGETYGLPDSTFQKIKTNLKVDEASIKKISINTVTKEELKMHPYFKWTLANAIVEYRNQHGNFSAIEDLKKISLITDDIYNKIKFYLAL